MNFYNHQLSHYSLLKVYKSTLITIQMSKFIKLSKKLLEKYLLNSCYLLNYTTKSAEMFYNVFIVHIQVQYAQDICGISIMLSDISLLCSSYSMNCS